MNFSEKLKLLRKNKGFTQEEFAEQLHVSRIAVAKWESGQSYPDIANLIQISNIMNVTIDYLVRDQECAVCPMFLERDNVQEIIAFRLEANVNTYASFMNYAAEQEADKAATYTFDGNYGNTYTSGSLFDSLF